ncbi:MAG TPA: nicotinate-nicotinamide nucleotide adenylyltransferase [Blastocatellia bacterium]|nr:nicotinate-nicotinamide nucleotide adenylyltransferase [Blastocatellia bacterium]
MVKLDWLNEIIERVDPNGEPHIEFIKRAEAKGSRLGVFASSFNPVTIAHVELMRRARDEFSLDETFALAGKTNADKTGYECSLADRLTMLMLTFNQDEHTSIGISSHAFYVDMVDALAQVYAAGTDLHFIVGFDTFVRVLDRENKYTEKYHRKFTDRADALHYLLARSRLIVAARAGAGYRDVRALVESEPAEIRERILYLDFPDELADRSATEVRKRVRAGQSITGLVPSQVETFIHERELYR